jgi:hypothetical protein
MKSGGYTSGFTFYMRSEEKNLPTMWGMVSCRGLLTRASLRRLPIGAQVVNLMPLSFQECHPNQNIL